MPSRMFLPTNASKHLLLRVLASALATGVTTLSYQHSAQAVTFNFNFAEDTSSEIINGVQQAGWLWGSVLQDDVTVNIDFEFGALSEGYLGGARPDMIKVNYADTVNQFGLDQTSVDDQSAFANLPTYENENGELSISRLINGTIDVYGFWHTDNSTKNLWLTRANAKSLGLIEGNNTSADAAIRLSDQINWDFDSSDGVGNQQFDFVSTVVHEIGHTLGFFSGVDILDSNVKNGIFLSDEEYDYVTSMDLFRHSRSTAGRGKIDWTVDSEKEYFSIDGGEKQIASFANGAAALLDPDNFQLSHFKVGTQSVMAPTLKQGFQSSISDIDLQLMDAIGWDLSEGSQVNYQNAFNTYASDNAGFDGALTMGSWSSTSFNRVMWQEGSFLASKAHATTSQQVPEPSSLVGLGAVLTLLVAKKLRKR